MMAFPKEVHLNKIELDMFKEFSDDITSFGFNFKLNKSGINFHGTPADISNEDIEEVVSDLLLFYKENQKSWKQEKGKAIAKIFAKRNSVKAGEKLQSEEMNQIIDELFSCEMPFSSVSGKPTAIVIELNELIKRFN
jgi:DNA mismatch repair protein MutL